MEMIIDTSSKSPVLPKMGDCFRDKDTGRKYSHQGHSGQKVVLNSFNPKEYPDIEVSQEDFEQNFEPTKSPKQEQDE